MPRRGHFRWNDQRESENHLAASRSLAPELRALLVRYAALDLLIDQKAVEGGDPHALANAKLVQAELSIVKNRVEAYRQGKSVLYAARR